MVAARRRQLPRLLLAAALLLAGLWAALAGPAWAQADEPGAPTRFGVSRGAANTEIILTWRPPTGGGAPTHYEVQYAENAEFDDPTTLPTPDVEGSPGSFSHTVGGLTTGQRHWFRVRAMSGETAGPWTGSRRLHPAAVVTITPNSDFIIEGSDAQFRVSLSPAPEADTAVTVRVAAQGSFGVENGRRTVTVPAGEDGATLTVATTDGDDEEPGSITARVDRPRGYAKGTPNSAVMLVAVVSVEVVEEEEEEEPESGNQVSGQAEPVFLPTNFRVTSVDDDGVRFDWDAPSSGGAVTQYQVRWDEDADPTDGSMFTRAPGHPYWDTSRGTGVTTSAQIRAHRQSDGVWGDWTHVLYATGNVAANRSAPDKPTAPTVTPGDGKLTVAWTAPADHGYSIESYSVRHRQGTGSWTEQDNAWQVSSGGDLTYDITGLTNGSAYDVQVQAHSFNGASAWSATATGTPQVPSTDPTATVAATNATITEGANAEYTVTLSPAPASAVNVTYNITTVGSYGVNAAANRTVSVGTGGTGTITLTTTNDSTDEANGSVTVTLVAGTGYSVGTSNSATVTVNDDDTSGDAPNAPRSVSLARNDKNNELVVSWQAPDGATAVTEWQIQCDTSTSFNTGNLKQLSPAASGDLAFAADARYSATCTDLLTNQRYYARVRALNGTAESPWTAGASHLPTRSVVTIRANSDSITEGEDAVFTVTLHPAPASATDVTVVVNAVSGDYGITNGGSNTVTVGTGGAGTLTLTTIDDTTDEANGSVSVRVHPAPSGYAKGNPNSASMVINDNDDPSTAPTATVAADNAVITEGGSAEFTVTLDPAPAASVNVTYNVAVDGDYGVSAANNRTIAVGTGGTGTITLGPTTDDSTAEANGSVTVTLVAGTGYQLGAPGSASVTVFDNERTLVSIAPGASPVTEGTAARFTILPTGTVAADLVVTLNVSGGTDFGVTAVSRTVTLTPAAPVALLEVATTADSTAEHAADVTVTVQTGTEYNVGVGSASVRVNDDDGGLNAPANFRAVPSSQAANLNEGEQAPVATVNLSWAAPANPPQVGGSSAITGYELEYSLRVGFDPGSTPIWTFTKILAATRTAIEVERGRYEDVDQVMEEGVAVAQYLHHLPTLGLRQNGFFRIRAFTGASDARVPGPWSPILRTRPSEFDQASINTSSGVQGEVQPPGAPSPVILVPGDYSPVVYWGVPSDVGGNSIVAYDLRYKWNNESDWTEVLNAWSHDGGILSHAIPYRRFGETLEVQVHADSEVTANYCAAYDDLGQGNDADNRQKCLWGKGPWSASATATFVLNDYDADADGLIEVDSLGKLNAIRYDVDGDGEADDGSDYNTAGTDAANYDAAFPYPKAGMGCPDTGCKGYELTGDLDFDENTDGSITETGDPTYWNGGEGWEPIIGDSSSQRFAATFEGNGHTIANLFIYRGSARRVGLFSYLDDATVRNLLITGASVTGDSRTGILVGQTRGATSISQVAVSGSVTGDFKVGGLAGYLYTGGAEIAASYSSATVTGTGDRGQVGGLVGYMEADATVIASYATGSVTGPVHVGGLVGVHKGALIASYATGAVSGSSSLGGLVGSWDILTSSDSAITNSYFDGEATGRVFGAGSDDIDNNNTVDDGETNNRPGHTGAELRAPTGYSGIYGSWNLDVDNADGDNSLTSGPDDPWDFGANYNYPTLKNAPGKQKGPGPVGGLTHSFNDSNQLALSWTAPTVSGDGTLTGTYAGRYTSDGGATWTDFTVSTTSHTITALSDGDTFTVQVWALASGAAHTASLRSVLNYAPQSESNPTATVAANTTPITEGGNAVFTVTLSPAPAANVSVSYNITVSGDYGVSAATGQTVIVNAGVTTGTINLNTTDDSTEEASGSVTVTLVAGTGYGVGTGSSATVTVNDDDAPIDYDGDNDGLIEVDSLARLDAIRYDMNGDGVVDDSANNDAYAAAFPRPAGNQCDDPGTDGTTETCTGYELTASLDFDTNGNGVADSGDTYWNDGKGWRSIGGLENARYDTGFNAIFEGNGNTISNLFIDRESTNADTWAAYRVGLFGVATQSSVIRNLTLANVNVSAEEEVGALVGSTLGTVENVTVSGNVSGSVIDVGGVVGFMVGSGSSILSSSFAGNVSGGADHMGGLVGANMGKIRHSHATGSVTTDSGFAGRIGGLAGSNTGIIYASYSVSTVNAPNALWVGGLVGQNGGPYVKDRGTIVASYHQGDVTGRDDVGGLVGVNYAKILISYSTGAVTKRGQYSVAGGLVGRNELNNNDPTVYYSVTRSYYSTTGNDRTFGVGSDDRNNNNAVDEGESNTVSGHTTAELSAPTAYDVLYWWWDDYDQNGNAGNNQPWCFGTSSQLPTLKDAAGSCD